MKTLHLKTLHLACAAVAAAMLVNPAFALPEHSPSASAGRSGSQSEASIPLAEGAKNYAADMNVSCQSLMDKAGSMPVNLARDSQRERAMTQEDLAKQALASGDELSCKIHVRAAIDAMSVL